MINGTPIHVYTGAFATTGYTGDKPVGGGAEVIPTPPIIPSNPEASTPTEVNNVSWTEDNGQRTKVFRNGQLIIEKDGRFFNVLGVEVK